MIDASVKYERKTFNSFPFGQFFCANDEIFIGLRLTEVEAKNLKEKIASYEEDEQMIILQIISGDVKIYLGKKEELDNGLWLVKPNNLSIFLRTEQGAWAISFKGAEAIIRSVPFYSSCTSERLV